MQLNYATERLAALKLTEKDNFFADQSNGNISIVYRRIDGTVITLPSKYQAKSANAGVFGVEVRQAYSRQRLSPDQAEKYGAKYLSPNKRDTGGIGAIPFFPQSILQAFKHGKKITSLTFTEGEIKAAFSAKHCDIPAVAFTGISVYKLCDQVKQLLTICQPDTIIINYDADATRNEAGRQGEYKRRYLFFRSMVNFARDLFTFQALTGRRFNVVLCIPTGKGGKGLDDIFQSEAAAIEAYKTGANSEYFTFTALSKNSFVETAEAVFSVCRQYIKDYSGILLHGTDGEKLTDILERHGIPLTPAAIFGRQWVVPTGCGKTYLINTLASDGNNIVIAVPTIALANNIATEYGAALYTGRRRELIYGRNFIVTTYESLPRLTGEIVQVNGVNNYNLVVDEAHNVSIEIRRKAFRVMLELSKQFASFTTLTATPLPDFSAFSQLERVTVAIPQKSVPMEIVKASHTLKTAAVAVMRSIERGNFPIVLLNDTKETGKLGKLKAMLPGVPVAVLNSYKKQEAQFEAITGGGYIPAEFKALVTTTVLKEGNNIYNGGNFDIIIIGNFHAAEIAQLVARVRKAETVKAYWIRPETTRQSNAKFNAYNYADYLRQAVTAALNGSIYHADTLTPEAMAAERMARRGIGTLPIRANHETGRYELCPFMLNSMVFEAERAALCKNESFMLERLKLYGFTGNATNGGNISARVTIEPTPAEVAVIDQAITKAKAIEADSVQTAIIEVSLTPPEQLQTAIETQPLGRAEKLVFEHFLELLKHCDRPTALQHLNTVKDSKSKTAALCQRLNIQRIRHDANHMASGSGIPKVIAAIYERLSPGEKYTADQLRGIVVECLELDKGLNLYKYLHGGAKERNDRVLKVLKYFFDVTKKNVRTDGGTAVYWFLTEIDQRQLFGNYLCANFDTIKKYNQISAQPTNTAAMAEVHLELDDYYLPF